MDGRLPRATPRPDSLSLVSFTPLRLENGMESADVPESVKERIAARTRATQQCGGNAPTTNIVVHLLDPAYLPDVRTMIEQSDAGATSVHRDPRLGRLYLRATPSLWRALSRHPAVQYIEPAVYRYTTMNDIATTTTFINATTAWNTYGLTGKGQIIGHCDSGLDRGVEHLLHPDFTNRIRAAYSFRADGKWDDPDGHGTHTAGSLLGNGSASAGQFKGVAYEAEIVHQSAYAGLGALGIPTNLYTVFTQPHADGARIHSDSWGSSQNAGRYSANAHDVDRFVWDNKDMVIVFAAGNAGVDENADGVIDHDGGISTPATAKNIITVGAAESARTPGTGGYTDMPWGFGAWEVRFPVNPIHDDLISESWDGVHLGMAAMSSRGPCADGRIKPDVVAPGTDIVSCRSRVGQWDLWGQYNSFYNFSGGSSMATPLVAGAAALLREYCAEHAGLTNPSAALVKALLVSGARSLSPGQYGYGTYRDVPGASPDPVEGWGMIDLGHSLEFLQCDDSESLATGDTRAYPIPVSSDEYLHATLVWTDRPGTPGAGKAIVNDLDVVIIGPAGSTNYANNGASPDKVNTVETVGISPPTDGTYTVEVHAHSVMPPEPQPFALVIRTDPVTPPHHDVEAVRQQPETVTPRKIGRAHV